VSIEDQWGNTREVQKYVHMLAYTEINGQKIMVVKIIPNQQITKLTNFEAQNISNRNLLLDEIIRTIQTDAR
jgi:hypothetical protein